MNCRSEKCDLVSTKARGEPCRIPIMDLSTLLSSSVVDVITGGRLGEQNDKYHELDKGNNALVS